MLRKQFSLEQIVTLLRQIEVATSQGKSISIACRAPGLSCEERAHGPAVY